jgi:thiamine biosynthesis protein ThiC
MNEGPGHVPLHKIPENMRNQLVSSTDTFAYSTFRTMILHYAFSVLHMDGSIH